MQVVHQIFLRVIRQVTKNRISYKVSIDAVFKESFGARRKPE